MTLDEEKKTSVLLACTCPIVYIKYEFSISVITDKGDSVIEDHKRRTSSDTIAV